MKSKARHLFGRIFSIYAAIIFTITFFILLPFFLLTSHVKPLERWYFTLNRVWTIIYHLLLFMPFQRIWHFKPEKDQNYIFVSNHFSFMDIPSLVIIPTPSVFIGKSSISKVPIFGYIFDKMHIKVDRSSKKSRAETLKRAKEKVEQGKSLNMFAEGGIKSQNPPHMEAFKDGAFSIAIEKKVPVVPVALPYTWKILDVWNGYRFYPHRNKAIFFPPIDTSNMSLDDLEALKEKTFSIIQEELIAHH